MKSGTCDCSSRARSRSPRLRLWLADLFQALDTRGKGHEPGNRAHIKDAAAPPAKAISGGPQILASAKGGPAIRSSAPAARGQLRRLEFARKGHSDLISRGTKRSWQSSAPRWGALQARRRIHCPESATSVLPASGEEISFVRMAARSASRPVWNVRPRRRGL